jgi:hypothetical protein
MQHHSIQAILVPQGAEYKSVCRGLRRSTAPTPPVFPIPVGVSPLTGYLKRLQQAGHLSNHPQPSVLLMGLCGSLTPRYNIGDIVLYERCLYRSNASNPVAQNCDRELTAWIHHGLKEKVSQVKALTSDRLIYSAKEKLHLGQRYEADVVDMEGFAVLEALSQVGAAVAMLRVVSDDCNHDIPDLSPALSADGSMRPLPMAIAFGRQPIAATRLITGALRGLQVLEDVAIRLFQ